MAPQDCLLRLGSERPMGLGYGLARGRLPLDKRCTSRHAKGGAPRVEACGIVHHMFTLREHQHPHPKRMDTATAPQKPEVERSLTS